MIYNCPNCGFLLSIELNDGISHCSHCNCVFDSSLTNQLLSAAWFIRKKNVSLEQSIELLKIDSDLINFVYSIIKDCEYTHEEFCRLLNKLNIPKKSYE
jgi:hypothetical protein